VGLDGRVQREIPGLPLDAFGLNPSVDGTKIAFITSEDFTNRIGTIDIDGTHLKVLDPAVGVENDPDHGPRVVWSPDDSQLAFVGVAQGNTDIYVMNADGTDVRRLTTSRYVDEWPAWSPDGSTIVYDNGGKTPNDSGCAPTKEIYTVPASGGTPKRLSHNDVSDSQPSYSAAGGGGFVIAFNHDGQIWVMNADGSGAQGLADVSGNTPRLSPDGSKIAFTTYNGFAYDATLGSVSRSVPTFSVQVLDRRTGRITPVGQQLWTASDVNGPAWISSNTLLLNLVQTP
jgi:Tol biopolymer transport system component